MRNEIQPPTATPATIRAAQSPESRDYRRRSAVAKLKKILLDSDDITELDAVRAAVDELAD